MTPPSNTEYQNKPFQRRPENDKGEIVCLGCTQWLPRTSFRDTRHAYGGKIHVYQRSYCRKCEKKYNTPKSLESKRRNAERVNKRNTLWRINMRLEAIEAYGGKCVCCGESRREFLTIDHINGRGDSKKIQIHMEIQNLKKAGWPKINIQLLCFNCNCSKGIYGSCPHAWNNDEHKLPLSVTKRKMLYASDGEISC